MTSLGPTLPISVEMFEMKYAGDGESHSEAMARISDSLKDSPTHFRAFLNILRRMAFLPGGRIQSAMGSTRRVTPYNCFVSGIIEDDFDSIFNRAHQAGRTMRLGGGIGYCFSRLRPYGDLIRSLQSKASGPISFMDVFNSTCKTVASSGHRRGAQMAVLRVDHPDIEAFVRIKQNTTNLTAFNISVGITDEFMRAVVDGRTFDLRFEGKVYKTVDARTLWNEIMRSTWDWAEPGVVFLDTMNRMNNLWYIETLEATNPCAEQPLPPFGACLLGSINLTQYLKTTRGMTVIDYTALSNDIPHIVRAMDNVVDRAIYPLPEQEREAKDKRRMGIGVTGLANALEAMGFPYGSAEFLWAQDNVQAYITQQCYWASVDLAKEKGSFPLLDREKFVQSGFMQTMPEALREAILEYGIRNSHLTSIAPTGTISIVANNVSSGVEPVFSEEFDRTIQTFDGPRVEKVTDYGYRVLGNKAKTANECSVDDHLNVLLTAQKYIDSAVSKTCNVGDDVTWEEFKDIYMKAWRGGAKGCTTFRAAGKRMGILMASAEKEPEPADNEDEPKACFFDPDTGMKSCE